MLTAERLREILHYDPATGEFRWHGPAGRGHIHVGAVAGGPMSHGYWRIGLDGRRYLAHRLAWLYMTGTWPRAGIDHVNCGQSAGLKGASWDKRKGKWLAQATLNGKGTYLGRFRTREEAHYAYMAAAKRYFGEYARAS